MKERLRPRDFEACTPEELRICLEYLYGEALAAGLKWPAHFISVAAEAAADCVQKAHSNGARPADDANATRASELKRTGIVANSAAVLASEKEGENNG
jgi:hypothetical protein